MPGKNIPGIIFLYRETNASMMNREIIGSQYILNVLNEDIIYMIVWSIPLYEINREEGI